jgi:hypothetical protein
MDSYPSIATPIGPNLMKLPDLLKMPIFNRIRPAPDRFLAGGSRVSSVTALKFTLHAQEIDPPHVKNRALSN